MAEGTITLISLVLTLMVFSYVLGDLPLIGHLYRTAVYIFVGMSAAFATIVIYEGVILPYLQDIQNPATSWTVLGNGADVVVFFTALLFGMLLLLKPIASLSWLTNGVLAVVIVVSAATAGCGRIERDLDSVGRGDGCRSRRFSDGFSVLDQHLVDFRRYHDCAVLFSMAGASQ